MEKFDIHVLGCGCAMPTLGHHPSAQILNIREKLSLIDCGEGTQLQMRHTRLSYTKLRNIFISHLHGDHCFGLLGIISTFGMLGRTAALHIYGPATYEKLFAQELQFFCPELEYTVTYHPLDTHQYQNIYEDRSMTVYSIPLNHRVPCCGYLFKEKPTLPHIKRDMIDFYHIPFSELNNIKNGHDYITPEGETIPWQKLTTPSYTPRSYAYISDTSYLPQIATYLEGTTLLYHESTFCEDRAERARATRHSTARQAAQMATACHAEKLLIGHFSAHYHDERQFLEEAKAIFPNTLLAHEGLKISI